MKKNSFLKNILTVSGGKVFAMAFTLLSTPIIARIFTPADFGPFAFFLSVVTIASAISSFRFEVASVLPDSEDVADHLISLAVFFTVTSSVIAFLGLGVWYLIDPGFVMQGTLKEWVWLIPVGILVFSLDDALIMWLVRHGKFKPIAQTDLLEPLVTGGSRIGFGLLTGSSASGLILGFAMGRMVRLWIISRAAVAWIQKPRKFADRAALIATARNYKDYPLFSTPTALVFVVSNNLPFILLGTLFAPAVLGYYAMANRLLRMPIQAVSEGVRKVFLKKAAKLRNDGKRLDDALGKLALMLAGAGIPPFLILYLYADHLLTFFLGEKWELAGEVVSILAPWLFVVWVSTPCSVMIEVCKKQGSWMRQQLLLLVMRAGVFGLAVLWNKDYIWTLNAFVAVSTGGMLLNLFFMFRWAREASPSVGPSQ